MRPDELIEESVDLLKNSYQRKMLKTKELFFKLLKEKQPIEQFVNLFNEIWKDLDYKFIQNRIKELEEIVDSVNKVDLDKETLEFLELVKQSRFNEVFKKYQEEIGNYYKLRIKTIDKGVTDVEIYLSDFVDKYDKYQKSIPYFDKNGLIHSWHDISDYSSMLFNTNLLRTAINRTMLDADYLDMDLIYIPAHNFACPLCIPWQGRIYSKSGTDKRYPKLDEAYSNGLGHPNCKHVPVIYWDSTQIQQNKFDSDDWIEKYKINQKIKALDREKAKLNSDLRIYKSLNNQTKIDSTRKKLKKIRLRLSEMM